MPILLAFAVASLLRLPFLGESLMARGRMISKSLSTSQCYAELFQACPDLAEFCQSLYPLLVAHSDDFGRMQGDVFTVRHAVHPTSPRTAEEFTRALQALHDVNLIERYQHEGRDYVAIAKFDDHQTGLHKRTRSSFPAPPGTSRKFRENPGQLNRRELKGTEQKRTEEKHRDPARPTHALLLKLWHLVLDEVEAGTLEATDPTSLVNIVKCRAGEAGIDYAAERHAVERAHEAVLHQRANRRSA